MSYSVNIGAADINFTSLQGYVNATLAELEQMFGPGEDYSDDHDKVTREWNFTFTDNETGDQIVASLYDYKMGTTPTGAYDWHIGGHDQRATELLTALIETLRQPGPAVINGEELAALTGDHIVGLLG